MRPKSILKYAAVVGLVLTYNTLINPSIALAQTTGNQSGAVTTTDNQTPPAANTAQKGQGAEAPAANTAQKGQGAEAPAAAPLTCEQCKMSLWLKRHAKWEACLNEGGTRESCRGSGAGDTCCWCEKHPTLEPECWGVTCEAECKWSETPECKKACEAQ